MPPRLLGLLALAVGGACARPSADAWRAPPRPESPIQVAADSDAALWRGLGSAHAAAHWAAMDRARRLLDGRLAEREGPSARAIDAFSRALGLDAKVDRQLGWTDSAALGDLLAYAEGVNAARPAADAPWAPRDSLLVVHLLAWTWSAGTEAELAALASRGVLGADDLDALTRLHPGGPRVDDFWRSQRTLIVGPLEASFVAFMARTRPGPSAVGEGWARGDDANFALHTRWEQPAGLPVPWAPAELRVGERAREAITLPGVPWAFAAREAGRAWALLPLGADTVDLALLPRHGREGVTVAGAPQALAVGALPAAARLPENTWARASVGPVISALDAPHVVALRWSALEVTDQTPALLAGLWAASSLAQTSADSQPTTVLPAAVLHATLGEGAGFFVPAALPRRRGFSGRVPYPAGEADVGWNGWLDRLPERRAAGVVALAGVDPAWPLAQMFHAELQDPAAVDALRARAVGDSMSRGPAWIDALAVRAALASPATPAGQEARRRALQGGPEGEAVLEALVRRGAEARLPDRLPEDLRPIWAQARRVDARWAPADLSAALDALDALPAASPSGTRALGGGTGAWHSFDLAWEGG